VARIAVLRGDARRLPLPDGCVDLIVTSPPYYGLRSYTDGGEHYDGQIGSEATPGEYVATLVACTREWVRVLKPSGSLFVNLGDKYSTGAGAQTGEKSEALRSSKHGHGGGSKWAEVPPRRPVRDMPPKSLLGLPWRYALACMDQLGLILRAEIVWAKPNGLPESVTDRLRRAHEQVFHFTRLPRYYSAVDEIREPSGEYKTPGRGWIAKHSCPSDGNRVGRQQLATQNPLGKLPGSVWTIPSAPLVVPARLGVDHFAAFPPALVRPIVLGWSPPGVCQACGEGRRPVADVRKTWAPRPGLITSLTMAHGYDGREGARSSSLATVTGYACACTPYTLVDDNPGAAPWKQYHFDSWQPPPTRPALVLDPFGGTGTTALVAAVHGRHGITIDASSDYCRLAAWRCHDPGERARALDVPRPPVVPDDQVALFDV
jgi:DNA modification methylase